MAWHGSTINYWVHAPYFLPLDDKGVLWLPALAGQVLFLNELKRAC